MLGLASRLSAAVSGVFQRAGLRSLSPISHEIGELPNPGGLFSLAVRYNIRNHFPRPCERKRIRRHGWVKRMSTAGGQRILMHRILKGKHVYSH